MTMNNFVTEIRDHTWVHHLTNHHINRLRWILPRLAHEEAIQGTHAYYDSFKVTIKVVYNQAE
jgi:hypothetical protein